MTEYVKVALSRLHLFAVCLDVIITKWQKDIKRISLKLVTLLFVEDLVIISNTEDNLQKAAYKFSQ